MNVAVGLIEQYGNLLITKRKPGTHLEGFWEFPGGKQEYGESLDECLKREIWEELGIVISPPIFFMKVNHQYPGKSVNLHVFRCSVVSGTPQAIGCVEWLWVRKEQLETYSFPKADQVIIETLKAEVSD